MVDTPILNLRQYAGADAMVFTEVNQDNQTLDLLPPTVCTSATRPSTDLFIGRLIYETDTDSIVRWDGGTWVYVSRNGPWPTFGGNSWQSNGTAPALGNGTLVSKALILGKNVDFRISLLIGSTSTAGTGGWAFTLPSQPKNDTSATAGIAVGTATYWDTSVGTLYAAVLVTTGSNGIGMIDVGSGAAVRWGGGGPSPIAIGTGDLLTCTGRYESV